MSAAAIVEIRKARMVLASMHEQMVGWNKAKQIIEAVEFFKIPGDSGYLPQVGKELLSLFGQLLAYSHEAVIQLEVIRHVKEIVDAYHKVWKQKRVRVVCEMMHELAKRQGTLNKVYQSAMALVKYIAQLTQHKSEDIKKIPQDILEMMQQACPRERGDETVDEYLKKMKKLASLTIINNDLVEEHVTIEEEIRDLEYEPDIL